MKKIILALAMGFSLVACTNDDNTTLCIPEFPGWELILVDANNNTLIGSQFVQDSFKLSNAASTTYVRPTPFGPGTDLQIVLPNLTSGMDYYLELSQMDSDTLNIEFEEFEGSCGPSYRTLRFQYNDQLVFNGQGNFVPPAIVTKD